MATRLRYILKHDPEADDVAHVRVGVDVDMDNGSVVAQTLDTDDPTLLSLAEQMAAQAVTVLGLTRDEPFVPPANSLPNVVDNPNLPDT